MKHPLSVLAVGHATSAFLAITFALCVGYDLFLPGHAMFHAWQQLLPGFRWLSWGTFLLGLVESYAYGWYAAAIWVPIYNVAAGSAAGHAPDADARTR